MLIGFIICVSALTYWYVKIPKDKLHSDASVALESGPAAVFTDLEGNVITFESYEGKVRIVSSWASWNPFSVSDLQTLNTIAGDYKDKEVFVIAINRKESKEQAERFLSTLPNLEHLHYAIDVHDSFYASIGGYAMPETVVYDAKGNVAFHKRGISTEEELRSMLDEVLKQ